jgi:hypothetical protein
VRFVGVGLLDNAGACRAFVKRYHLTFPNGYDGDGKIAKLYGFTYQPYWAVIDAQERLVRTGYGPENESELVATIKTLTGR